MFSDVKKGRNARALALAFGIGGWLNAAEAASSTTPENLGSAIVFTQQNDPEFYYCFIDMKFFSYPESGNCKASRTKLDMIATKWNVTDFDTHDERIFLRILTKIFDVYSDRFLRRDP
ncbi:hypothetical protein EFQ99_01390 [Rhizobium vallis]|uniref:Uncharacterized protein n=1 Tax=Rhizobium vallis TaxID=634290 RepID=A0A3S0QYD9_9HYPH|nr:hypothetical protein [Rhizobium vallis]RUM26885.1 hypothetical protein EFQ99_01390 [Rhizobium vallis]